MLDAGYRMLGAGAQGRSREMIWGGRWKGGSGLGTHVHPWWIHVNVWQNKYSVVLVFGIQQSDSVTLFFFFFNFYFYFILLYNTVLVLPYIDMNLPWVYMSSQSWNPLPLPTPYHLSGSSLCTSPKHPVSYIEHRLAIHFLQCSFQTKGNHLCDLFRTG